MIVHSDHPDAWAKIEFCEIQKNTSTFVDSFSHTSLTIKFQSYQYSHAVLAWANFFVIGLMFLTMTTIFVNFGIQSKCH